MTGEELFVEIGKIDENMMLEAENCRRKRTPLKEV